LRGETSCLTKPSIRTGQPQFAVGLLGACGDGNISTSDGRATEAAALVADLARATGNEREDEERQKGFRDDLLPEPVKEDWRRLSMLATRVIFLMGY